MHVAKHTHIQTLIKIINYLHARMVERRYYVIATVNLLLVHTLASAGCTFSAGKSSG